MLNEPLDPKLKHQIRLACQLNRAPKWQQKQIRRLLRNLEVQPVQMVDGCLIILSIQL